MQPSMAQNDKKLVIFVMWAHTKQGWTQNMLRCFKSFQVHSNVIQLTLCCPFPVTSGSKTIHWKAGPWNKSFWSWIPESLKISTLIDKINLSEFPFGKKLSCSKKEIILWKFFLQRNNASCYFFSNQKLLEIVNFYINEVSRDWTEKIGQINFLSRLWTNLAETSKRTITMSNKVSLSVFRTSNFF